MSQLERNEKKIGFWVGVIVFVSILFGAWFDEVPHRDPLLPPSDLEQQ